MATESFGGTQPLNYEQRCPVVLLIDTSPSMRSGGGECTPIEEVNAGLQLFARQVRASATTSARLDVAIVTFNSTATVAREFALLDEAPLPVLETSGSSTDYAAGIDRALALIADRRRSYDEAGSTRGRPHLVFITDGAPTNSPEELAASRGHVQDAITRLRYTMWAFGTTGSRLSILRDLFGAERVQGFAAQDFSAFFLWLSASFERITASREGEVVQLDNPGFFRHTV